MLEKLLDRFIEERTTLEKINSKHVGDMPMHEQFMSESESPTLPSREENMFCGNCIAQNVRLLSVPLMQVVFLPFCIELLLVFCMNVMACFRSRVLHFKFPASCFACSQFSALHYPCARLHVPIVFCCMFARFTLCLFRVWQFNLFDFAIID